MATCTVCSNAAVLEIDKLLASGSSVRQVARMFGIPRTTLARHTGHIAAASTKFAVIEGQGGPQRAIDPLDEAFALAERARTPRERLRALEQVRAATKLRLRGIGDPDSESRDLLDDNIRSAMAAYRDAGDFETSARALSGWREAITQRLGARQPEAISTGLLVTLSGGEPLGEPAPMTMSAERYWAGVPTRYRDLERFQVERTIKLHLRRRAPPEEIKVRDMAGAVVWAR
jgi:hypothetical protein